MEFIGCSNKLLTRKCGHLACYKLCKAFRRVKSRSYGSAAEGELLERLERKFEQLNVTLKTASPAGNFLREGDGSCILQMRTSALYNALILRLKAFEGGNVATSTPSRFSSHF